MGLPMIWTLSVENGTPNPDGSVNGARLEFRRGYSTDPSKEELLAKFRLLCHMAPRWGVDMNNCGALMLVSRPLEPTEESSTEEFDPEHPEFGWHTAPVVPFQYGREGRLGRALDRLQAATARLLGYR